MCLGSHHRSPLPLPDGLFPLFALFVPPAALPPLWPPSREPAPFPDLLLPVSPDCMLRPSFSIVPPFPPFSPCRGGSGTPVPAPKFCFGINNLLLYNFRLRLPAPVKLSLGIRYWFREVISRIKKWGLLRSKNAFRCFCGDCFQPASTAPPLILRISPVICRDQSESKKQMDRAMSSVVAMRLSGIESITCCS